MSGDSTQAIEESLRTSLTSIRRDWTRDDLPHRGKSRIGPTPPIPASQITRMSITQDLAFWTLAATDSSDGCLSDYDTTVDTRDPVDMCRALLRRVRTLSGWAYAGRMDDEMRADAEALRQLTHDDGLLLGACPVELPDTDGTRRPCGRRVRAHLDKPSDVRCPGCGTRDTIEGWQRRIVGSGPVTEAELAKRLIWLGQRVKPSTIRQWVARGAIPPAVDTDDQGRSLYDPEATMRALMAREERRRVAG